MSDALHFDAHAAGAAGDGPHGGFEVRGGEVRLLGLRDLFGLLARELADLVGVRRLAALLELERLADQHRGGRALEDEREALVRVRRDDDGEHEARIHLLGLRVERLAELHDVEAALAERGTDGRRGIRLARRHLELDQADDLLCHETSPVGSSEHGRCRALPFKFDAGDGPQRREPVRLTVTPPRLNWGPSPTYA